MAISKYNDPQYWRDRAIEARQIAEGFTNAEARKQMLDVAEGYDRLVKMAERLRLMHGDESGDDKR